MFYSKRSLFRITNICIISICILAFAPSDIAFKNINLLPDLMEKEDRIISFVPKAVKEEKPVKIFDKPKIPDLAVEEKVADMIIKPKGFLKEYVFTTQSELQETFTPTVEGVKNMFHLKELGINMPTGGGSVNIVPLKKEAEHIPILNDLPGMKLYGGTWIVKDIKDIQAVGIDKAMPKSPGAPFKPADFDIQPVLTYFPAGITPNDMLDTTTDLIP